MPIWHPCVNDWFRKVIQLHEVLLISRVLLIHNLCPYLCHNRALVSLKTQFTAVFSWDLASHFKQKINWRKIVDSQRNFDRNISNLVVSTVHVDGLTPLGTRVSAATVMTKFWSLTYIYIYIYIYTHTQIWHLNIRVLTLDHAKMLDVICGWLYVFLWPVEMDVCFHCMLMTVICQTCHHHSD